ERGDRLVNELNPLRTKEHFGHQLLQDMAQASIEIGARTHAGFQLVPWPELRDQGWKEQGQVQYVPDKALNAGHPPLITVRSGHTRGDGAPFLLKHDGYQLFILGKEIDRGTEPLTTTHESRRHIKQKLAHYKELFDEKRYKVHYGFPNSMVL